ncbi:hypothetical protein L3X38_014715 [Prunus dulcis]|uniref:Uncharacterized protein n=1 Tax=Prunus dulcis TaxID=3755 RepID=A0AAD4ZIK0_PRUDU|nr:hypothetical protein L3X38_014715 [Prunus dulcis]
MSLISTIEKPQSPLQEQTDLFNWLMTMLFTTFIGSVISGGLKASSETRPTWMAPSEWRNISIAYHSCNQIRREGQWQNCVAESIHAAPRYQDSGEEEEETGLRCVGLACSIQR